MLCCKEITQGPKSPCVLEAEGLRRNCRLWKGLGCVPGHLPQLLLSPLSLARLRRTWGPQVKWPPGDLCSPTAWLCREFCPGRDTASSLACGRVPKALSPACKGGYVFLLPPHGHDFIFLESSWPDNLATNPVAQCWEGVVGGGHDWGTVPACKKRFLSSSSSR